MKIKVTCAVLKSGFGAGNRLRIFFHNSKEYEAECNRRKYSQFMKGTMTDEEKRRFFRNIGESLIKNHFSSSWLSIYEKSVDKGEINTGYGIIDMYRGYDNFHICIAPADTEYNLESVLNRMYP